MSEGDNALDINATLEMMADLLALCDVLKERSEEYRMIYPDLTTYFDGTCEVSEMLKQSLMAGAAVMDDPVIMENLVAFVEKKTQELKDGS